jgi:hypothetical protein
MKKRSPAAGGMSPFEEVCNAAIGRYLGILKPLLNGLMTLNVTGQLLETLSDFIEIGCKDAKLCTGNFFGLYLTLVLFHYRAY